jgi:Peptidase A4 family
MLPAMLIARLLRPAQIGLALALPVAAAAPTALAAPAAGLAPAGRNGLVEVDSSHVWAGYAANGSKFRYVQATFRIPYLNCRKTPGTANAPAFFADWVGLDGLGASTTVEQDGIAGHCLNGTGTYQAWWETIPRGPVFPRGVTVSGGDTISVQVYYDKLKRAYEFTLADQTNGESFSLWHGCAARICRNDTAEVITEDPSRGIGSRAQWPMADCRTTTFYDVSVTDAAGHKGGFTNGHWANHQLMMLGAGNNLRVSTSSLSTRGSEFSTTWLREN